MEKRKREQLIPWHVLREAYLKVARSVGASSETFLAETRNIELIRQECGPDYSHVRLDWIRAACGNGRKAKRCGSWNVFGGHGACKLGESPEWYRKYLRSEYWQDLRYKMLEMYEHHCSLCCGTTKVEVHHNSYHRLGNEHVADLAVVCSRCHKRHHKFVEHPPEQSPLKTG